MADHSPAARAIVAAFNDRYELCGPFDDNWQEVCLAAALRAAADLPECDMPEDSAYAAGYYDSLGEISNMADELEKSHD